METTDFVDPHQWLIGKDRETQMHASGHTCISVTACFQTLWTLYVSLNANHLSVPVYAYTLSGDFAVRPTAFYLDL